MPGFEPLDVLNVPVIGMVAEKGSYGARCALASAKVLLPQKHGAKKP